MGNETGSRYGSWRDFDGVVVGGEGDGDQAGNQHQKQVLV